MLCSSEHDAEDDLHTSTSASWRKSKSSRYKSVVWSAWPCSVAVTAEVQSALAEEALTEEAPCSVAVAMATATDAHAGRLSWPRGSQVQAIGVPWRRAILEYWLLAAEPGTQG